MNSNIDLTFNHPVKELVWVCQSDAKYDTTNTDAVKNFYQTLDFSNDSSTDKTLIPSDFEPNLMIACSINKA